MFLILIIIKIDAYLYWKSDYEVVTSTADWITIPSGYGISIMQSCALLFASVHVWLIGSKFMGVRMMDGYTGTRGWRAL